MTKERKNKSKKPIFKKWWFWAIIAIIIMGTAGGNGKSEKDSTLSPVKTTAATETAETEHENEKDSTQLPIETTSVLEIVATEHEDEFTSLTEKEQIEKILTDKIEEEYTSTVIERITINDNLGTEEKNDYIALVYLTWNQKNSGKTSKEMLRLYSDDLAATLANQNDTVKEIAIFWTVPYLNDSAKCSYERVNNGFAEMDMVWGKAFN